MQYQDRKEMHKINHANIKDWAKNYDGELFDGILCDPPYHLVSGRTSEEIGHPSWNSKTKSSRSAKKKGFMGKDWDGVDENGIGIAQDPEMWRLLYNLLKPGAHLLAFSGSRTYHRMAVAIEDAGFEIRDTIIYAYGSGFPKALDIHKQVQKIDPENNEWLGYKTALKPAFEPCVLARKPLDGTVAQNVLKHGTGGLNIDGTRIGTDGGGTHCNNRDINGKCLGHKDNNDRYGETIHTDNIQGGRFPANLIHDGSDEVEAVFPQTGGGKAKEAGVGNGSSIFAGAGRTGFTIGDSGSASRYFYCAKASKSERNAGLEGFEPQITNDGREKDIDNAFQRGTTLRSNHHPTVKPLSLTKYLATLIKPPTGGRLLVPFSGSGSEMIGALQAGWEYVEGVELTEEYIPIAEARIKYWQNISQTSSKPKVSAKNAEPVQNTAESLTLF